MTSQLFNTFLLLGEKNKFKKRGLPYNSKNAIKYFIPGVPPVINLINSSESLKSEILKKDLYVTQVQLNTALVQLNTFAQSHVETIKNEVNAANAAGNPIAGVPSIVLVRKFPIDVRAIIANHFVNDKPVHDELIK